MNSPIGILLLEDDPNDAGLIEELLQANQFMCRISRVQDRDGFLAALQDGKFDLILSDHQLPLFDGLSALNLARGARPEIPFIFVSGTLGEEAAIEALKVGATDYVLKTGLSRLVPAVQRALGEANDRAARKRAEGALRRTETELRDVIEAIPAIAFTAQPDGSNVWINRQWVEFTGLSAEETLGSGWQSAVHPDDLIEHAAKWHRAMASGEPFENEARYRSASAEYRWFLARAVPLRDEQGGIVKWYGILTDITERKRAEERLRVQRTVGQLLAEAATIEEATPRILRVMGGYLGCDVGALWRVDRETETLRCVGLWHKASIEVLDFERVSRDFTFVPGLGLPGRVWSSREPVYISDLAPDENFPRGPIAQREGLRAGSGFPILLGGEVVGVVEFFSREIKQPDHELLKMLATIGSEIGQFIERKRAEAEARDSERRYREVQAELAHASRVAMMGQLMASIAHEIKQPIAAAINNARAGLNWLNAQPPDLEEVRQTLGSVVSASKHANGVIDRIRALIKKAHPRKEDLEINEAVLEIIALTRTEILKNDVSVRTHLAEGLPHVHGDRVQLQQVLLNLIINAIEAMRDVGEEDRELVISTGSEPDGVCVEVRDSGPGFTPATLARVFEPFYTTKSGGLGLGLSICRSIIEAHGGRLWAGPNQPRGAIFRFIVPAHPADA